MDSLEQYWEKRNFEKTPEPENTSAEPEEKNRFVVQWHHARRKHFDFRLQVGHVLASWAIPKKPVDNPDVKRLAIQVEDHPLSYIHFEGKIPKGNYGAGTVMVWDIGYYYLDDTRKIPSKGEMIKRISKGSLKLYLQGTKLKGYYNLVKMKNNENNEWFFMKVKKEEEKKDEEEISAMTGLSMDEIAASDAIRDPEQEEGVKVKPVDEPTQAEKSDFPGFISPMLATLTDQPFSESEWIYELKLDGYRVIAAKEKKKADLYSRNGNSFTERYHLIAEELSELNARFIIDGEVCYMDQTKKANFQKLQHNDDEQERLHYYVFDILWLNGHDLKNLPLTERKKLLQALLSKSLPHIHYLDHVDKEGHVFFKKIEKDGLEGIIAKKSTGRYFPAERSKEWLKIKTGHRQEMVICGYLPSDKPGRNFRSLLCAVNEGHSLIYTGKVGTGFNEAIQQELMKKLKALETDEVPVNNPPSGKNIRWVKPELICEVKFSTWTTDRVMRHPSFIGLRSDKDPGQITIEKPEEAVNPGSKVTFSNLSKIFWPDEKITKEEVIGYYRDIAEVILPYLKDRPQSLYRTPEGIIKKGFFQKNVKEIVPDWVTTVKLESGSGRTIEYLLCQDTDTLLYMINLGCIEINPWSSSMPKLDNPDYMVFDLDPVELRFKEVVILALEFKKLFDKLGLPAFCKTSGSRGLHIYIPVQQNYSYGQVQNFVKILETYIHRQNKDLTSFERAPSARQGKIYLDYLQNARGKTMASVYSLRPRPGAPVSAPVRWEELTPHLTPDAFTLRNMRKRLEKEGDLWSGMFEHRVDMQKVLERIG
ncbi:MAG: DNA ligase D [Cyclobacteriaceae bacterium]|nr:DNA ligase D [Cyclobacteriaceae bacterium]